MRPCFSIGIDNSYYFLRQIEEYTELIQSSRLVTHTMIATSDSRVRLCTHRVGHCVLDNSRLAGRAFRI